MVEVKERISDALKIRGKNAKELSDLTGIPKSSISQYMSGKVKPKQNRIYLIAKALRINEAWLIGYDVPMECEEAFEPTKEETQFLKNYREVSTDAKELIDIIIEKELKKTR